MEGPILPQILGFTLNYIEKDNKSKSYACYKDINNFIRDHNEKIKYINWDKVSKIYNTYKGKDIQELLRSVTVLDKVKVYPLTTYFEDSEETWDVTQAFGKHKKIITTSAKVIKEIIRAGRSTYGSFAPKLSASQAVLEGKCIPFPGKICETTAVKRIISETERRKIGKGMKLEQDWTAEEGGHRKPYDMYAILCLETNDAVFIYYAEIDTLGKKKRKPTETELVEIKLMPDVFKKKEKIDNRKKEVLVPVENNVKKVFNRRCPQLEEVDEFMPVLEGILRRADKLQVAYFMEGPYGNKIWKYAKNYAFYGMGLSTKDVETLNSFAKSLFTLKLPTRAEKGSFEWMDLQTKRSPTGNGLVCKPMRE